MSSLHPLVIIELKHFLDNCGFETLYQDSGVAFLMPLGEYRGQPVAQWNYVENYGDARIALDYTPLINSIH